MAPTHFTQKDLGWLRQLKLVLTTPADLSQVELEESQEKVSVAKGAHPASYSSRIRNKHQGFWLLVELPC